jgi:hypothetical protein
MWIGGYEILGEMEGSMETDLVLREQLLALLRGGNAHDGIDEVTADFPVEHINRKPLNVEYSFWQLLEHLRITQWDILEFVRNPQHVSPKWPEGYWPSQDEEVDQKRWDQTLLAFKADLEMMQAMVSDPQTDLVGEIPHAPGYTILREVLLVADHNAYHIGEFGILRQVAGTWPRQKPLAADLKQFPPFL